MNVHRENREVSAKLNDDADDTAGRVSADSIRWEDWKIEIEIESELGGQFRGICHRTKVLSCYEDENTMSRHLRGQPSRKSFSFSLRDRLKTDFYDLLQSAICASGVMSRCLLPACLPAWQPSCLFIRQMHLINESQCCATQMRSNVIKPKQQQQQQQQQLNQVERKSWSRNRSRNKKATQKFHFCLGIFRFC